MPFYDLRCGSCNEESNISATMTEKTEGRIPCPKCGSTDMRSVYNKAPFVSKSKGIQPSPCANRNVCGTGCPHAS